MADALSRSLLLGQGSGAQRAPQDRQHRAVAPAHSHTSGLDFQTPPGVPGARKAQRHL